MLCWGRSARWYTRPTNGRECALRAKKGAPVGRDPGRTPLGRGPSPVGNLLPAGAPGQPPAGRGVRVAQNPVADEGAAPIDTEERR
eukprot:4891921-Pyramimonas_sp.AAC.1